MTDEKTMLLAGYGLTSSLLMMPSAGGMAGLTDSPVGLSPGTSADLVSTTMEITAVPLEIPDAVVLEPGLIEDERGYFFEAWNDASFRSVVGEFGRFVQDNQSRSMRGALRGLHYQLPHPQGKLVRVIAGRAYSVGVDIRRRSEFFGRWVGVELSEIARNQLWLPPGFAHGLLALEEGTEVIYKVTAHYAADCDKSIRWDDPEIGIDWPLAGIAPIVSARDRNAAALAAAPVYD